MCHTLQDNFDSNAKFATKKGVLIPPATLVSIQALADATNQWCQENGILPSNGQAGERITERNIRFYRARGLLDAPGAGDDVGKRRGFSEKHAYQLRIIRLLQARSLPLGQIREQLRGQETEALQEMERQELRRIHGVGSGPAAVMGHAVQENWQVTAVSSEFLLVSRRGRAVTEEQRRAVAAALGVPPP